MRSLTLNSGQRKKNFAQKCNPGRGMMVTLTLLAREGLLTFSYRVDGIASGAHFAGGVFFFQ